MDPRIITNYPASHGLSHDFLYNTNDWDLIELNYNIDANQLQAWFGEIKTNFSHMLFNFNDNPNKLEIEKSKELVESGYCGYYCGPIDGITLAWPVERDEPLPPPVQANLEMFPEVNRKTFFDDAKIMPKFEFGYFKELIDTLGRDSFRQSIITRHHPGMYIRQHIDSKVLKLHIPIESNENSLFHFGKDRDRSYHLKVGKVYILNTGDWHGTSNDTDEIRSHIITRIADWQIDHVLSLC